MRIIGLDIGSKRIGVAMSDELGITAQPLETIKAQDLEKVVELVKEHEAKELVVGLPLNMNGSEGPKAKEVISLVDSLKQKVSVPVKMWDERLTTMAVEKELIRADVSRRKRKKVVDKLAAQLILQSYLDSGEGKKCIS